MGFNVMNLKSYRICVSMLNLEIQFVTMHVVRVVWKSAELKTICVWVGVGGSSFSFSFCIYSREMMEYSSIIM